MEKLLKTGIFIIEYKIRPQPPSPPDDEDTGNKGWIIAISIIGGLLVIGGIFLILIIILFNLGVGFYFYKRQ